MGSQSAAFPDVQGFARVGFADGGLSNQEFEIEDATSTKVTLDSTNSAAADYPALSVTAPLYGVSSAWCGSWPLPTPRS
jgi:hypothetical protein